MLDKDWLKWDLALDISKRKILGRNYYYVDDPKLLEGYRIDQDFASKNWLWPYFKSSLLLNRLSKKELLLLWVNDEILDFNNILVYFNDFLFWNNWWTIALETLQRNWLRIPVESLHKFRWRLTTWSNFYEFSEFDLFNLGIIASKEIYYNIRLICTQSQTSSFLKRIWCK